MLKKFPKEELWNHRRSHEDLEAVVLGGVVVLGGAVARLDVVVPEEAAVLVGGPEMTIGKKTTGSGAGAEAMTGVKGMRRRIEIIVVALGLVVPAQMKNAESEAAMIMRAAVTVVP